MYPKDVSNIFAEQANWNSLDNSYDAIKKIHPALAGGKKRGVKPGSNIKYYKTNEDWYLACEDYQKLVSQDIKIKKRYLLNFSHFDA